MFQSELTLNLRPIFSPLFTYSYALIPDGLQANQLLIDSLTGMITEETELFHKLVQNVDVEIKQSILFKIKLTLYNYILNIASRRESQLNIESTDQKYFPFYSLEVEERALVFLNNMTSLNASDMLEIFNLDKIEIINKIALAENKMMDMWNVQNPQEDRLVYPELDEEKCFFSRLIMVMINTPGYEGFYQGHLSMCEDCKRELSIKVLYDNQIAELLPRMLQSEEREEAFSREINELAKSLKITTRRSFLKILKINSFPLFTNS